MRREKPIMNLLMISNAFSFPWIGTHLVKVPFLFSSLVVLAVCVRARIFLFLSRFRSRSCFDFGITLPFPISIQIETQELIGWIGFWLLPRNAFISPCFTIFECRTMNISPRVARRCFALVEEFENGREIKAERTNKKHLYIHMCMRDWTESSNRLYAVHFAWTDRKMKWKPNIYFAKIFIIFMSTCYFSVLFFILLLMFRTCQPFLAARCALRSASALSAAISFYSSGPDHTLL